MTPQELISEGSSLMLFGMGFVFLFLTLLVLVTGLMSRIITRYSSEPVTSGASRGLRRARPTGSQDKELVAAIGAAIRMHRARRADSSNNNP